MNGMSAPLRIVAHRAANDLATLVAAPTVADVAEADVHLFLGRLEVRHEKTIGPLPILWERWYLVRRPRLLLQDLLPVVPPGIDLILDLKGPDPRLPRAVLDAATGWLSARRLIVSSRVWRHLDVLRHRAGISTFYSVGSSRQLSSLLRRYGPDGIPGVCVHRRLLAAAVCAALRERSSELWTWPVDDPEDAVMLAGWGVTGLISDRPELLRPGLTALRPGVV